MMWSCETIAINEEGSSSAARSNCASISLTSGAVGLGACVGGAAAAAGTCGWSVNVAVAASPGTGGGKAIWNSCALTGCSNQPLRINSHVTIGHNPFGRRRARYPCEAAQPWSLRSFRIAIAFTRPQRKPVGCNYGAGCPSSPFRR